MKISTKKRWSVLLILSIFAITMVIQTAVAERDKGVGVLKISCPDACNEWWIDLDQYGYSDWLEFDPPGQPGSHEMLSGEWAAAIYFPDVDTAVGKAAWLTDKFIYPTWETTQQFEWLGYNHGADNTTGFFNIRHKRHPFVEIDIQYELVCEGTVAMGTGAGFVQSTECIGFVTYTIRNTSGSETLNPVYFYQFMHGHPANQQKSISGVYDPVFYNNLNYPEYHYDYTVWARSTYGHIEYIGFASEVAPDNYEAGYYPAPLKNKPNAGTHISVENNALSNVNASAQGDLAGAMQWNLGSIGPGDFREVKVMLTMSFGSHTRVPSMSTLGLVILAIMLILTAAYLIFRRRNKATVGI